MRLTSDRDGAKLVLQGTKKFLPRLALVWVDGAYAGKLVLGPSVIST